MLLATVKPRAEYQWIFSIWYNSLSILVTKNGKKNQIEIEYYRILDELASFRFNTLNVGTETFVGPNSYEFDFMLRIAYYFFSELL